VASYLTLEKYPDARLVYCDTGGEHPDNKRFLLDVEKWLNTKVIILKNPNYSDHMDVVQKTRFVNGPQGARCTAELKKKMRYTFQQIDDLQVFGYGFTKRDIRRAERFNEHFPEITTWYPLIEQQVTERDCIGFIQHIGIDVPAMYKLGYDHNNCLGCVKGKKGYWNKLRRDGFTDVFERMAQIERQIGHTCIPGVYLDELQEGEGNYKHEEPITCDFICQSKLT
jgi:3'-phosphoadenosine 5'-phosphosulfate sulfotransferase (PAPS reductase)/FAD synthetase